MQLQLVLLHRNRRLTFTAAASRSADRSAGKPFFAGPASWLAGYDPDQDHRFLESDGSGGKGGVSAVPSSSQLSSCYLALPRGHQSIEGLPALERSAPLIRGWGRRLIFFVPFKRYHHRDPFDFGHVPQSISDP